MSRQRPEHPDTTTTSLIWNGVEADQETVGELQPLWQIPDEIAVKADVGHHHQAPAVIQHSLECIDAGACAVHLHIRDDEGRDTGDMGLWREVVSEIKAKRGDDMVIDSGLRGTTFEERMSHIREGLFDVVPIIPTWNRDYLADAVRTMNEHGVKAEVCVWDATDISLAKSQLLDKGLLGSPSMWLIVPSCPFYGTPMPTPELALRGVSHLIDLVRNADPDAHISVSAAGRGSSYLCTIGMLLGHHVRPGIGETFWRWPHIEAETPAPTTLIADAIQVARGLGREPMSASRYREILGL